MLKSVFKNRRAFMMLEFLVYSVILAGIAVFAATTFGTVNRAGGQVDARVAVNANIRIALEKIRQDVREMSEMSKPLSGTIDDELVIVVGGNTITYALSGTRLTRKVNSEAAQFITADEVSIATLAFRQFHNVSIPVTQYVLGINTSITASYDSSSPDYNFSATQSKTSYAENFFNNPARGSFGGSDNTGGENCGGQIFIWRFIVPVALAWFQPSC